MKLRSPAFKPGGELPARFTQDAAGWAPPLEWSGVPQNARELVVLFEEPDEPFVHWVVYGIPPEMKALPEGTKGEVAGVHQGTNSLGKIGYEPPLGTTGREHRYLLRLLALDGPLGLGPGVDADALRKRMAGQVVAEAALLVVYERPRE